MKAFGYIENLIDSILENFDATLLNQQMTYLIDIIALYVTLQIVIRGLMIWAGKSQEPIKELMWNLVKWWFIFLVAYNVGGGLDLINNAIKSFHVWAGGGDVSLYVKLDEMLDVIVKIGIMMEDTDGTFDMVGLFSQAITWFGFLLVAIPTVVILMFTQLTLKLLLILTPLILITLLFGWLKPIFSKWLETLISNILTLIFVGLFFKMLSNKYQKYANYIFSKTESGGIDVFTLAGEVFLVSIVMSAFVFSSIYFASKLSGVSMDTTVQESVKSWWKKVHK